MRSSPVNIKIWTPDLSVRGLAKQNLWPSWGHNSFNCHHGYCCFYLNHNREDEFLQTYFAGNWVFHLLFYLSSLFLHSGRMREGLCFLPCPPVRSSCFHLLLKIIPKFGSSIGICPYGLIGFCSWLSLRGFFFLYHIFNFVLFLLFIVSCITCLDLFFFFVTHSTSGYLRLLRNLFWKPGRKFLVFDLLIQWTISSLLFSLLKLSNNLKLLRQM